MKHARKDYDRIQDPAGLIPEDEPVFLLRGQDVFAPKLLRYWANMLDTSKGGDHYMAAMVRDHADLMDKWQDKKRIKLPDLPQLPKSE